MASFDFGFEVRDVDLEIFGNVLNSFGETLTAFTEEASLVLPFLAEAINKASKMRNAVAKKPKDGGKVQYFNGFTLLNPIKVNKYEYLRKIFVFDNDCIGVVKGDEKEDKKFVFAIEEIEFYCLMSQGEMADFGCSILEFLKAYKART